MVSALINSKLKLTGSHRNKVKLREEVTIFSKWESKGNKART
ncbi:hypothetical protein COLO4_08402 [Corchorus olitorius]|uniref:Uncharacterized protein n=1 Tax=Corchorus olitorius TaxID=93759 RepID=A0A1R3KFY3_9ROSI|nr:hypothetical protein COLO4_08402 [Corchorus olitorius]